MVGSAVHRALSSQGVDVLTAPREILDLSSFAETRSFIHEHKPNSVVLAAAKVGGILANSQNPEDFLTTNLRIQESVISAAKELGIKKFVFLGSSCIYPKMAPQPISESSLLSGPLEPTNEAYALAKITGLRHVAYARKRFGKGWFSVMPTNLYGPGDTYDSERSHVIPALILKMHEARESGRSEVKLFGTGRPLREFLHVDDLANAILMLLEREPDHDFVNIGSSEEISIADLAHLVAQTVGFHGEVVFDPDYPDGTPRKLLDSSKVRELGWKPRVSLTEGIRQVYDDYLLQRAES